VRPIQGVPGVDFKVDDVRGQFPEELEIKPLGGPVDATVRVPGSKSVTNRALIVAALSNGTTTLQNPLFSDDSYWLMSALVSLGFDVDADHAKSEVRIGGRGGGIPSSEAEVYVGNAGTAARFLPPFLALGNGEYRLDGTARMRERPVEDLVEALRGLGGEIRYAAVEGYFPLLVSGRGLRGGTIEVAGDKSSQFLSGLLMAAPYSDKEIQLKVKGTLVSRPYIGITLGVMKAFGVSVEVDGHQGLYTVPSGIYEGRNYEIEPDASAASYFMAAAAVTGGRVMIPGLGENTSQGDMQFLDVLKQMGCEVEVATDRVVVRGPQRLRGVSMDMNDFSDTMMTLAAIAPFAEGETEITNVEHTRHQETDRVSAVATELRRLGVTVDEQRDSLRIIPTTVKPALVRTYGDHRMAMAFAVTGLIAPGVRIADPVCVTKTFPEYFRVLESLR
jgi:3-phosphoshikimate 1-carboxyvinyltransferase